MTQKKLTQKDKDRIIARLTERMKDFNFDYTRVDDKFSEMTGPGGFLDFLDESEGDVTWTENEDAEDLNDFVASEVEIVVRAFILWQLRGKISKKLHDQLSKELFSFGSATALTAREN